jgi:2-oxoglutarate ferredoxin oxidoreductase subunit alpha
MQEGMSYIAGSEVPAVLVDIMRGGPGLGNIQPSQADYFQITRSAGHGDYHPIVLAPSTVQEAVDLMMLCFDLAFRYRHGGGAGGRWDAGADDGGGDHASLC